MHVEHVYMFLSHLKTLSSVHGEHLYNLHVFIMKGTVHVEHIFVTLKDTEHEEQLYK